jgi:hypothetical protein
LGGPAASTTAAFMSSGSDDVVIAYPSVHKEDCPAPNR